MVEDSETDAWLMQKAFEKADITVPLSWLKDGAEAIQYLSGAGKYHNRVQHPLPTVILLDLKMPGRDGFDVLAWLKCQDGLKRLFVSVLSSSARREDINRAYDLGANYFMVKPSSLTELAAMMKKFFDCLSINTFPSFGKQPPDSTA